MPEVHVSTQVVDFCRGLPPQPRRKLRPAIRDLESERGDIKPLEGRLSGYHRLRSGAYRVVVRYRPARGKTHIDCLYANHRSIIYEILESAECLPGFEEREG